MARLKDKGTEQERYEKWFLSVPLNIGIYRIQRRIDYDLYFISYYLYSIY